MMICVKVAVMSLLTSYSFMSNYETCSGCTETAYSDDSITVSTCIDYIDTNVESGAG